MTSKILLVDDIQDNLDLLEDLLDDEFNYGDSDYKLEFTQATCGNEVFKITKSSSDFDLILLDIMMPDIDGFEVCEKLKANDKTKDIPIIFITAKTSCEDIVKGFDIGASDYVSKPFQEEELIARVKKELKIQALIKHLEFTASHDPMTGIYNRRKFFELAVNKFNNNKENLYAMMIDIDKFKAINDLYGHHIGDKVIINTANTINELICEDTIFGRIGGEEFAIVCNPESDQKLDHRVEEIRKTIESLEVYTDDDKTIKFTISLGVAKYTQEIKDLDEFLKQADIALYEAKETGRNKSIFRGR
jgi:diguanylate cyclase (GGDEF)-like protein